MARDRKRAKQRRERRGTAAARRLSEGTGTLPASQPTRADVPAALDHASGDVDEFDAAIVRGAGGVPAAPEAPLTEEELAEGDAIASDDIGTGFDDQLQEGFGGGSGGANGGAGGGGGGRGGPGGEDHTPAPGAPLAGGNRAIGFLRASWAELQRVQWPDRRQVTQATAVVIGFVAIAGAYLGIADYVAKEFVELIL